MIFKFPKKKIMLDCFVDSELLLETAPIELATKHIPEWWRQLPKQEYVEDKFFPLPTMKTCVGFVDYYRNSVAIPLWSDLYIKVDGTQYQWQFSDRNTNVTIHNIQRQAKGFLPNHGHMKIESPWYLRTKENINWVWSQPLYNFNEDNIDLKIAPGIVNYSKQEVTNLNLVFKLNEQKIYALKQGQVLIHITPMTENKIQVVRHLVSKEEIERLKENHGRISFIEKYKTISKQKQKFSNCPFHNHIEK